MVQRGREIRGDPKKKLTCVCIGLCFAKTDLACLHFIGFDSNGSNDSDSDDTINRAKMLFDLTQK